MPRGGECFCLRGASFLFKAIQGVLNNFDKAAVGDERGGFFLILIKGAILFQLSFTTDKKVLAQKRGI
jgi:hypothetical protein